MLHYSLFGILPYRLDDYFLAYLDRASGYKVAFFQDEHHYCGARFAFLNRYRVDCVYTLLEPVFWKDVYERYTGVPKLVHTIPGYVSDDLVAQQATRDRDEEREIDIGYRGRTLLPYMGRGSQEKAEIGLGVLERARASGLRLDIAVDEGSRIYGDAWLAWLANCRATLGTEAGASIFDLTDQCEAYERLVAANPDASEQDFLETLERWEGNVDYRAISPRHPRRRRHCASARFFREGNYSGVLEPMVHYIPLKKDFSNWDEVLDRVRDTGLRRELTANAYRDLIASERYSYSRFIEGFDRELVTAGVGGEVDQTLAGRLTSALARDQQQRERAFVFVQHWPAPSRVSGES